MPSFKNPSLKKYEDRFFTTGIGRFSFSIHYHDVAALTKLSETEFVSPVRSSAEVLLSRMRTAAPYRYGALRDGLIVAPGRERSKKYGKVVNDIVFDATMNDTFVKMSKAGDRYYYPASQEFGFKIGRSRRVPGRYYMRDTAAAFYAAHEEMVVQTTINVLEAL